jgi:L-malate glycosyltransferase
MRILILSDINSAHSQKWIIALAKRGITVGIYTLSRPQTDWYNNYVNVSLEYTALEKSSKFDSGVLNKLSYLKVLPGLKKCIEKFKPDIIHAHYATSYGLLARLSHFKPYVISAWGSDVMDFPGKSVIHKSILKRNLNSAAVVMATSETISLAIKKVTDCKVNILPFGIDLNVFKKKNISRIIDEENIVIGTVKSLEEIYGIDTLIQAFHILKSQLSYKAIKLLIVGSGTQENVYKSLVKQLKLDKDVIFTGKIEYEKVADYHNMIDIFVNVSRNESFGVSVIEASACEKPVVVSNVGGLPYVVINNVTGFIVNVDDSSDTARAIETLINDSALRLKMGAEGRQFVEKEFELNKNTDDLIGIYEELLKSKH